MNTNWRRCSSCKKPIAFGVTYWVCNVSTCNRKRTGLVFCNVSCWDAHVPMMNHRESWAEERKAPTQQQQWDQEQAPKRRPPRPAPDVSQNPATAGSASATTANSSPPPAPPRTILRRSR